MNIKQYLTRFLSQTCCLFTGIILIYTVIVALVNPDANEIYLSGLRILFFFIFSIFISGANLIYGVKTVSAPIRLLIHYIMTAFAVYLCLLLPSDPAPSKVIVGIVLFSILYFIGAGILAIIRSVRKKQLEKKEVYVKKFSK